MRSIQMVDTKGQYMKIKSEIDAAIHDVLESSMFIGGKKLEEFRENLAVYNGSDHVVPCANGTDALQIAMMALGLTAGDEVITPSFTYIATVEVAALLNIKPIFVEVDPQTFCIDPAVIEKAILNSDVGITPMNNGETIRLGIPPLTEERRKILVKQARHEGEETKISIRNARREAIEQFKKMQKVSS